jgi:hypothetical protein
MHLTATAASGSSFRRQLDLLRPICTFHDDSQAWHTRIGALGSTGLHKLNTLFEAARYGTQVEVRVEYAPDGYRGPVFSEVGEDIAAALAKQADAGRRLGQVV